MGGFLGIGGSGQKTDRKTTLQGYGDLENIFNYGIGEGKGTMAAGEDSLGDADAYYKKLLSGNRVAQLQAVAPTVNAANAEEDAQKKAIADSGTARGGGVNATTQQLDTTKSATIDSAITGTMPGAAKGEESVGATQAQIAANLLGLGENATVNRTSLAIQSRPTSNAINQQTQEQVGAAIAQALKVAFG